MPSAKKRVPVFVPAPKPKRVAEEAKPVHSPRPGLKPTDIPGVYINSAGVKVGTNGVALTFKELKRKDTERFKEASGEDVVTPADLLKAVAMDPRHPLPQRIDAANKAAPYFTAKRVAIQGGGPEAPPIDLRVAMETLPQKELDKLEKLLAAVDELISKGASK